MAWSLRYYDWYHKSVMIQYFSVIFLLLNKYHLFLCWLILSESLSEFTLQKYLLLSKYHSASYFPPLLHLRANI